MMDPITYDHLKTLVEKANNGKPSQVYLCWVYEGRYIITTIRLDRSAILNGLRLGNINHDWQGGRNGAQDAAELANTYLEGAELEAYKSYRSYLYDNYWFAFAKMMQLNAGKLS